MNVTRYAVYYTFPPGPLAGFGAAWLGWDAATGTEVAAPQVVGLSSDPHSLTTGSRRYGLHATIKPPFRLARSLRPDQLITAFQNLCANCAPVVLDGLTVTQMGRFLALTPDGDTEALHRLAERVVTRLDRFRAPPGPEEIARRRTARLTPMQEALLTRWGHPYVMDAFRMHVTLTDRLQGPALAQTRAALATHLAPLLPRPFLMDALTLCGEDDQGRFHELHRVALTG